jgi:hypothetical protein
MRCRSVCALLALSLLALASGCCHDCWCSRHPCMPGCRAGCAPQPSCCCNPCAYPPLQTVPPPPAFAPPPPGVVQ